MSLAYMYTIRSRETGEVLFKGRRKECCAFLGCSASTLSVITSGKRQNGELAQRYIIDHEQCAALDRKDIICEECGCLVRNVDHRKRLCPACAQRREKEQRKREQRERTNPLEKKREPTKQAPAARTEEEIFQDLRRMQKKCAGCIYLGGRQELKTCNYIFLKDRKRPCPPGDGCTVKTVRKSIEK